MQKIYYISWIIVLILFSCSHESENIKEPENQIECVVIESQSINDSILSDKTVEYYWHVTNNSQKYHFKKHFFVREYDGLKEDIYVVDSLNIDLSIDSQYEITKVDNWPELYQKVKDYTDQLLDRTPEERRPEMIELIEKVVLDSAAIVNKNTQDIQIYFLVLQEFSLGANSDDYNFIHTIEDSIETITNETIIDFDAASLPIHDLSFIAGPQETEIHNSIVATRNIKTNGVIEIKHMISTAVDGDSIVKTRVMTFY